MSGGSINMKELGGVFSKNTLLWDNFFGVSLLFSITSLT